MNKWTLLFLTIFTTSYAALPPVWQGVAEIKAIVEDPKLSEFLNSGDILESITKSREGWVIKTSHSSVFVQVIPLPQEMPGPMKFELQYSVIN